MAQKLPACNVDYFNFLLPTRLLQMALEAGRVVCLQGWCREGCLITRLRLPPHPMSWSIFSCSPQGSPQSRGFQDHHPRSRRDSQTTSISALCAPTDMPIPLARQRSRGPAQSSIVRAFSVVQLCLTFCDPMDCSPPGSSVHGISQARILEWAAISSSRGSS